MPTGEAAERRGSDEDVSFSATDGFPVAGSWFLARGEVRAPVAVIVSTAAGAPQRFYHAFASYLADRGLSVLTYDFRGMGRSRPASLRGFEASLRDWIGDCGGAIVHARGRFPEYRIRLVGHSMGGLLPVVAEHIEHVDRMVMIGTQTAYWRDAPPGVRYQAFVLWHLMMPFLTRLWGYFPGRALGMGEDLPKQVALDWAGRFRHEDFTVALPDLVDRRGRCRAHILSLNAEDDRFATPAAEARLRRLLADHRVDYRRFHPRDLGLAEIGHFGYFRSRVGSAVWDLVLDWVIEPASAGEIGAAKLADPISHQE